MNATQTTIDGINEWRLADVRTMLMCSRAHVSVCMSVYDCMCVCVCGGGWVGACVRACDKHHEMGSLSTLRSVYGVRFSYWVCCGPAGL